MRVAVFRAQDDGARTAARLAALGHEPLLAPVLRIVATAADVPTDGVDGILFTSAHAPEALQGRAALSARLTTLPCWCVGAHTAAAARAAGFTRVLTGPGDAEGLAAQLRLLESQPRLLLLAGRDRKPVLEHRLKEAGLHLDVVECYRAEAVPGWPADAVSALATAAAALHYSGRSAALADDLARAAGLQRQFHAWRHYCLSEDIAAWARNIGLRNVTTAEKPNEDSLLACLADAP